MDDNTSIVICVLIVVVSFIFFQRGCTAWEFNENEYRLEKLRIEEVYDTENE